MNGAPVERFLADAHLADALVDDPTMHERYDRLRASGRIWVGMLEVQQRELRDTPDTKRDRRDKLVAVEFDDAPAAILVLDVGMLLDTGNRIGGDDESALYEAIRAGNDRHIEDAVLGVTAIADNVTIVSDDHKLRATQLGARSMGVTDLLDQLVALDSPTTR